MNVIRDTPASLVVATQLLICDPKAAQNTKNRKRLVQPGKMCLKHDSEATSNIPFQNNQLQKKKKKGKSASQRDSAKKRKNNEETRHSPFHTTSYLWVCSCFARSFLSRTHRIHLLLPHPIGEMLFVVDIDDRVKGRKRTDDAATSSSNSYLLRARQSVTCMRQGYVILLQYPNSPPRLLLFAGRQIMQQQLSQFSSPCCIIRSTSRQKPRSLQDSVDSTARQTRWNRKTTST